MDVSKSLEQLTEARRLAQSGRHAAVVEYLAGQPLAELENSPTLALLYGTAQARLGKHAEGARWVDIAVDRSRQQGDRVVEARALNVRGAIALEAGRIDEAAGAFMRALAEAEDPHAVGRASNNLGIIANLRGDHGRAVGSYTMALAAFQQVDLAAGVALAQHNLAISYRDQGELEQALETADRAAEQAVAVGDVALQAQTVAGQAEIRLLAGETAIARCDLERALAKHREIGDVVGEAEDLRILANVLAAQDETGKAEAMLRNVIERADSHERPLLAATARRDLAHVLHHAGRLADAMEMTHAARTQFHELGASGEVCKLDEFLTQTR